MIHVRFEGRSLDVAERECAVEAGMSDAQIKARVAQRLDIDAERLAEYVVDRTAAGNVIVRPRAIYG